MSNPGNAAARAIFGEVSEVGFGGIADRADRDPSYLAGQMRTEAAFLLNQAPTEIVTNPHDPNSDESPERYVTSVEGQFQGETGPYTLRVARQLDSHGAPVGNYLIVRDGIFDAPVRCITKGGFPVMVNGEGEHILFDDLDSEAVARLADQIQIIGDRGRIALDEQNNHRETTKSERHRKVGRLMTGLAKFALVGGGLAAGLGFGLPELGRYQERTHQEDRAAEAAKRQDQAKADEQKRDQEAQKRLQEDQARQAADDAANAKVKSFDQSSPHLTQAESMAPGEEKIIAEDERFAGLEVPALEDAHGQEAFATQEAVRAVKAPTDATCSNVTLPVNDSEIPSHIAIARNGNSTDRISVKVAASGKVLQICGLGHIADGKVAPGQSASTIFVQVLKNA